MPEQSRIYARARPELADALVTHPLLGAHVYAFARGPSAPFAPPPRGLLVVKVPDVLWCPAPGAPDGPTAEEHRAAMEPSLWTSDAETSGALDLESAKRRFGWVRDVLPDDAILAWLRDLGRRHRVPVAWYHHLERGDDLYYELAFIYDGDVSRLLVHSTLLASGGAAGRMLIDARGVDDTPAFDFILPEVWRALGARGGPAYFPPDDDSTFDWETARAPPREGAAVPRHRPGPTTDALVDAIIAAPEDDAPRLVWADREGGERGELVVIQCRLAQRDVPREERRRLVARERQLLTVNRRAWTKALPADVASTTFVRGFVEEIGIGADVFARLGAEIFERAPHVRALDLRGVCSPTSGHVGPSADERWVEIAAKLGAALRAIPPDRVRRIRGDDLVLYATRDAAYADEGHPYGQRFIQLVAEQENLSLLESFECGDSDATPSSLEGLARLPSLERLYLSSHRLGVGGAAAVLQMFPRLRRFAPLNGEPAMRGDALAELLAAPGIQRIIDLELGEPLHREDAERLRVLRSLERLAFRCDHAPVWLAEMEAPLTELEIVGPVEDATIAALARAPFAPRLRRLRLRDAQLTEAAALELLSFPALEHFHLQQHGRFGRVADVEAAVPDVHVLR